MNLVLKRDVKHPGQGRPRGGAMTYLTSSIVTRIVAYKSVYTSCLRTWISGKGICVPQIGLIYEFALVCFLFGRLDNNAPVTSTTRNMRTELFIS